MNIKKIIPPRRFTIPFLGLILAVGALAQKAQPVLSNQIAKLQSASLPKALEETGTSAWMEQNSNFSSQSISKGARLRKVLDNSSASSSQADISLSPGKTYTWMQRNDSSDYKDVAQDNKSVSTIQARVSEDKISTEQAIPANNFPSGDGIFLYGSSQNAGEFGQGYIEPI